MATSENIWVKSPQRLSVELNHVNETLAFLESIETASLRVAGRVLLDLAPCAFISRSACLMLTAQIDRCNGRRKGSVGGLNPHARDVCQRLHDFGFYEHLKFNSPGGHTDTEREVSIAICSGRGAADDLSKRLEQVASLALPLFGDPDVVDAVHEALNEAVTNIVGHAYAAEVTSVVRPQTLDSIHGLSSRAALGSRPPAPQLQADRWWFAGYANRQRKELSLFALDHGHSVPAVAPFTMRHAIDHYFAKVQPRSRVPLERRSDAELLEAVARARRMGFGTGRRGKGFPTMISLVENETSCGRVRVLSGKGIYEFAKIKPKSVPREQSFNSVQPFSGTLIEWRMAIPDGAEQEGE